MVGGVVGLWGRGGVGRGGVVGVVVCCFDFAVSSARLGPIRRSFSRNDWPGRVERSARESATLSANGERLRIVELQGALFFGSIRTLANAQVAAQWEFDFFGRHRAALDAALGQTRAAQADLQAARRVEIRLVDLKN